METYRVVYLYPMGGPGWKSTGTFQEVDDRCATERARSFVGSGDPKLGVPVMSVRVCLKRRAGNNKWVEVAENIGIY